MGRDDLIEHERIWLEPANELHGDEGRTWCQDNVWGDNATEYGRADIAAAALKAAEAENRAWLEKNTRLIVARADKADAELAAARAEIERLKEGLGPFAEHVGKDGSSVVLKIGNDTWTRTLTTEHFNRARALLDGEQGK